MIVEGRTAGSVGFWSSHLLREDTNARAEVMEIRGLVAEDLPNALREMQAVASGSRCGGNFMYSANINPRDYERLTPEQWIEAVDTLERNLGLEGHQRVVVEHEKEGRTHRHVIWNRVDVDTMRVADLHWNYRTNSATARELEAKFELTPTPTPDFSQPRPRAVELWEHRAAERSGIPVEDVKRDLTEAWKQSDSGQGFAAAVEAQGYTLARGDRRDFVVLDAHGEVHSIARRIDGVKAADVRGKMADLDPALLPSVAEARAEIRAPLREQAEAMQQLRDADRADNATLRIADQKAYLIAKSERESAAHDAWADRAAQQRERLEPQPGRAALEVAGDALGVASKLSTFVSNLLAGGSPPRPDSTTSAGAMQERKVQQRALAAMERIADSIAAGERLKPEDVSHLHPSQLENIRARGDDALRAIIDSMERGRELYIDYGRTRER